LHIIDHDTVYIVEQAGEEMGALEEAKQQVVALRQGITGIKLFGNPPEVVPTGTPIKLNLGTFGGFLG
jgi:hypothetical protein